ncbi:hypothetical protein bcgnr5380_04050 [Bacillus cereus]
MFKKVVLLKLGNELYKIIKFEELFLRVLEEQFIKKQPVNLI